MKIANDRLNPQVLVLEDAETEIRKTVIDGFFRREFKEVTARKIKKIIEKAVAKIKIPSLKETARRSLTTFADKQHDTLRAGLGGSVEIVAAVIALRGSPAARQKRTEEFVADLLKKNRNMPVPRGLQPDHYVKTVIERMDAVFNELVKQAALDPEDVSGRNSLRNKAEMEVRYQRHKDELADMKAKGGLWICSVHADCSDRCAPYQGRVYSMDGTSGRTEDGREYVPLEYATQNPRDRYTTKAGRTYQNGLFGFNCFDDKTEVFTDKGWRLFQDLDGTEKIYTLSPETRQTEWQTPLRYFKDLYDGQMVWLHNYSTDLMCTPNHNLLYFTQKDNRLRFKPAAEFSTATFLYAGQEWSGIEPKTIRLGGKEVDAALYCRFMAYYLADGSKHSVCAVKIAQQDNVAMFAELQGLPFKVWHDGDKIVVWGKELTDELSQFGKAADKCVPQVIKTLSRRLIREFLDAYLRTDGYTAKSIKENGKVSIHKSLFTTSEKMANDLCELALKAGYRPKLDRRQDAGKEINFKNGRYKINHDLFVVHLNKRVNITHIKKDEVPYRGFIYCLEVPNHTLLVKRNGRIVWCGNCRHTLSPYKPKMAVPTVTKEEQQKEYEITKTQREYERRIRREKIKAVTYEKEDPRKAEAARRLAREITAEYERYSRRNNRAFYPRRTQII